MFIEYFLKCRCPNCKVANWVYDSHSERAFSSNDIFAIKCWNCHSCNWAYDEAEDEAKISFGDDVKIEDISKLGEESP